MSLRVTVCFAGGCRRSVSPICAVLVRQLHPDQLADAALFHRHAVKNVRLRDRALVVGDDDELALRDETSSTRMNRLMFDSSSGASISSRMQNGLGRTM